MKKQIKEVSFLHDSLEHFLPNIKAESEDNIINRILKIIKDFTMIANIKESWLKEILTPEMLEFLSHRKQISDSEEEKIASSWNQIIKEIRDLVAEHVSPMTEIGILYGKKWMNIVESMGNSVEDRIFGFQVWQAYKDGKIEKFQSKFPDQKFFVDIPQDVIIWVDKAIGYMYCVQKAS